MYRIGFSRDIHRLKDNSRKFILGGVDIPYHLGNVSHSDGDCLYHSIAEALLGTFALGDLGHFFPDNDDKCKDMDSSIILKECYDKILERGYKLVNLDAIIILEKPHLQKYLLQIRQNIAKILNTSIDNISVKAQTNEHCGEVGNNEAIECYATVLVGKDL